MSDRINGDGLLVAEINLTRTFVEVEAHEGFVRVHVHEGGRSGTSTLTDLSPALAASMGRLVSLAAPNNRLGAALSTAATLSTEGRA